MALPNQKSNGRPMYTNKPPQFFKVILEETLRQGKLKIPKVFITKYGNGMSSPALLKVPSGDIWRVELRKKDGKVWFKNGWPEFSKHYALEDGHYVVFRYEGNSNFHVIIMDSTATEIDYPYTGNNHEQLNESEDESEDDDSIEIIEETPPPNINEVINLESECLAPQAMQQQQHNGVAALRGSCHQKLKAGKKLLALERASRTFQSENPFFMVVMQPSYVGLTPRYKLSLPSDFLKKHLMKGDCEITLCNSDGKTWPVKLHQAQNGKIVYAMLHAGWEKFVKDNNLQVGDVCAFELINCNEITLRVVKFQVKDGNRGESSSLRTDGFRKAGASSAEEECQKKLDKSEKAKALGLAKAFKSENPYFTVVMQPYYVHNHKLTIPGDFARRYFKKMQPKVAHEVLLSLPNGKSWPAVYWQNACAQLHNGWKKFVCDNKLEVGDVCVFELTKGNETSFNLKLTICKQKQAVKDSNLASSSGAASASRGKRVKIRTESNLQK